MRTLARTVGVVLVTMLVGGGGHGAWTFVRSRPSLDADGRGLMLGGFEFEVDPQSRLVDDGRLFFFYRGLLGDARQEFDKEGRAEGIRQADRNWSTLQ
jgi:hypothetical protein